MSTARKMALATAAFGVFHSVLASRGAKRLAATLLGERRRDRTYRAFFVAQSLVTFPLLVLYGASLPRHTVYQIRGGAAALLRAGQVGGVVHLLAGIRAVGFTTLAGVENVYRRVSCGGPHAQGPEAGPDGRLTVAGPFLWSRHPLNFAPLPMFWLTPHMTTRRLAFNLVSTAYLVLGSLHEERRLSAGYGEAYHRYAKSGVPFFVPRKPSKGAGRVQQAMSTRYVRVGP